MNGGEVEGVDSQGGDGRYYSDVLGYQSVWIEEVCFVVNDQICCILLIVG